METPSRPDPIERALRAGSPGEPAPDFSRRVMAALRREVATPPPLAFPWRRLVLGLAGVLAWAALGYAAVAGGEPERVLALARSWPFVAALALLSVLLSLRLARFCVRS